MDSTKSNFGGTRKTGFDHTQAESGFGWENRLAQTIVSMVIPKLQSAHADSTKVRADDVIGRLRLKAEAERFLALVLSGSQTSQWSALTALRDDGLSTETIFLDILSPAIRVLGELWEDDRMSFIDVTTKSAYLQQMLRRLGAEDEATGASSNRRILLAPAPGEQHTFGLFLLAEMFLKIGWDTVVEPSVTRDELCDAVASQPFDALGLSVGSELGLMELPPCVSAVRGASKSPGLRVFLGGWAFTSSRNSLGSYGADMVETDARAAVARAQVMCPASNAMRGRR